MGCRNFPRLLHAGFSMHPITLGSRINSKFHIENIHKIKHVNQLIKIKQQQIKGITLYAEFPRMMFRCVPNFLFQSPPIRMMTRDCQKTTPLCALTHTKPIGQVQVCQHSKLSLFLLVKFGYKGKENKKIFPSSEERGCRIIQGKYGMCQTAQNKN